MKVTDKQLLELFQLKIGDVIQSSDLKKYCDGIEFWEVKNNSLLEETRLYPLYNENNDTESPFGVGGIGLYLLIGFEFEIVKNISRVRFIKDMEYGECYELFFFEDKLQELKPFFILCDNLVDEKEQCGTTMQESLNMLCNELPAPSLNLITQCFEQLINKPYYDGNNDDDESNSK